jgi:rhodanese-related sulfurtransferase
MKHGALFLRVVADAKTRIREVDAADVADRLDGGEPFHLIDVREDREYAAGRIPGSIHIGKGVIERDIEARIPDLDAGIVLYCGGGYRSALAADALQRMGYANVASLRGGYRGWKAAGRPLAADGAA